MSNLFYYSIIFILIIGFLCGGILGTIVIRRMEQLRKMIQNQSSFSPQSIELTEDEKRMLLGDEF